MENEWEKVYPERINWANSAAGKTPVNETNLNKGDKALRIIDDRVLQLGYVKCVELLSENWVEASDEGIYQYVYFIETDDYSNESSPIATLYIDGNNVSEEEERNLNYIGKIWCSSTGIKVYALERPSMDVKLVLRGK